MISKFERYIQKLFLEQEAPANAEGTPPPSPPPNEGAEGADLSSEIMPETEKTFPEEIELAKLAVRAIYFNPSSKDVHKLKLKIDNREIPFEMISDYYETTKNIIPILGFVEWVMNQYEGVSNNWMYQPEISGNSIIKKIKQFNKKLSPEQKLDNGKRIYWTRIILNCLLDGRSNFNLNIGDINEKTIKEVFRLLNQHFSGDTRGLFPGKQLNNGPGNN